MTGVKVSSEAMYKQDESHRQENEEKCPRVRCVAHRLLELFHQRSRERSLDSKCNKERDQGLHC